MIRALQRFEAQLQERIRREGYSDVTVAHTNVLRHLNPEGMRPSELANDADVTKQAITQAIRQLQSRDLVAVEPDPDDGRAKRVVYTDRGRALIAAALPHVLALEREWAERLGADRYQTLRDALTDLI